jgi:hypothetical protein
MRHEVRGRKQMNIVHKAILHACWQKENEHGRHAVRPWLRSFLARVVGIEVIPSRKSERSRMATKQWCALRKEEALRIDPERAEVYWTYGQTFDPYGVEDLPEEYQQIQRNYFARSPGSDVWVSFDDLPNAVLDRLWERIETGNFNREDDLSWLV